jgi:uncharacterized protein YcfJ
LEAIVFGKSATFALALATVAAAGCASFPAHDPALDDARLSLEAARRNPQVAMYAPVEFDQAAATLRQADDLAANGGRYDDVHRLAVLAHQRAAAAQMQAAEAQRQADEARRLAAVAPAAYEYRRRPNEALYEAPVVAVRAVVGPPQQRCWVERQVVGSASPGVNVPGAVVGGVVGGILGHQIGSGRGQDVATGIGAATGAVVGANAGRDPVYTQDVQRCATVSSGAAVDYWDVTYTFRGYEHRMQTTTPPGRTILVNAQGEPRA